MSEQVYSVACNHAIHVMLHISTRHIRHPKNASVLPVNVWLRLSWTEACKFRRFTRQAHLPVHISSHNIYIYIPGIWTRTVCRAGAPYTARQDGRFVAGTDQKPLTQELLEKAVSVESST